jgi:predicted RNase H-like nuclease (RuvC/YqgF family)
MPRPIIVGYDPGMATAFAALDLRGNLLAAQGQREWPSAGVSQAIREIGQPLLIAVDRANASDSAEKLAARFGCSIWSPDKDLGVAEKADAVKQLVAEEAKKSGKETPSYSVHEKDALAAAIFAYKSFAGQFSKIDDTLAQVGMSAYGDEVKRMVLNGDVKNINEALEKMREKGKETKATKEEQPVIITPKKSEQMMLSKIKDLERSLDIQKMYIGKLETKIRDLEKTKAQMQEDQIRKSETGRRQLLENKEVSLRENMISNLHADMNALRKENEQLNAEIRKRDELAAITEEGSVPLVPVEEWSREKLAEADRSFKAKDRILWVPKFGQSNNAAKFCIALHPKAVAIDCDELTERTLRNADITLIKGLKPNRREFYGAAPKEEVERAARSGERAGFIKWLREYREQGA